MKEKKVKRWLIKPIIYTDRAKDVDPVILKKLYKQAEDDYQEYEDAREQAEKDSEEFWSKYDADTKRQLTDSELLKDTKSTNFIVTDESSGLTKEQVEYLRTRPKYVIGVDPANGKDQAVYNGKVVGDDFNGVFPDIAGWTRGYSDEN